VDRTLLSRDELDALNGLLLAAMADCDVPDADADDREELQRLARYRGAVLDALRGVQRDNWHPDSQAMASWLTGQGTNPLTALGHSTSWRTGVPGAAPGGDWMAGVLDMARPVTGNAPAPYVPPHPVRPQSQPARPRTRPLVRAHAVPGRDRIWIDVPHGEKNTAKQRGAIWEPVAGSWYAPRPGMAALGPWSRLPEVLEGEDRTLGQGLFVDLIPSTSWFRNVRAVVSARDWERIRQMVYRRAGMRCEACGATKDKTRCRWLECHERWAYRAPAGAASGVQALRRLICLCTDCHSCTHWGYLAVTGGPEAEQAAFGHLMAVTGMSAQQAGEHVDAAFELWAVRSQRDWAVDLSLISDAGIATSPPQEGDSAWAS
jgi:hypothetical protein